jgi:hypothetical protein
MRSKGDGFGLVVDQQTEDKGSDDKVKVGVFITDWSIKLETES